MVQIITREWEIAKTYIYDVVMKKCLFTKAFLVFQKRRCR